MFDLSSDENAKLGLNVANVEMLPVINVANCHFSLSPFSLLS